MEGERGARARGRAGGDRAKREVVPEVASGSDRVYGEDHGERREGRGG